MEKDSLYIDLKEWMHDSSQPTMTKDRIKSIKRLLEVYKIEEDEDITITGDYEAWGIFINHIISQTCKSEY
jgi:hypothetical protein